MKNAADNLSRYRKPIAACCSALHRGHRPCQKCCNDECHKNLRVPRLRLLLIHFIYFFFHSALSPPR